MIFLKFKNDVRVLFLMLLFKLDLCRYYLNLDGYPSIIYAEKGGYVCLKKVLDGRAPEYLTQKLSSLKYNKSYDTRSRLPYRLPIPRTNSMKRMFFIMLLNCGMMLPTILSAFQVQRISKDDTLI